MKKTMLAAAAATAAVVLSPAVAHADALPPNCISQPWGFLGSQSRQMCDGPIQADGSWMRHRMIGVPAHYVYPHSSCSGGTYYSSCTFYPGGYVDDVVSDNEWYVVTPETVLPDEPGHLG